MKKITKKAGNYVIVNHNTNKITDIFRKEVETKGFTTYLPEGAEVVSGTLEEVQAKYPDYTIGIIVKIKTGELKKEQEEKRQRDAELREKKIEEAKELWEQKRKEKRKIK